MDMFNANVFTPPADYIVAEGVVPVKPTKIKLQDLGMSIKSKHDKQGSKASEKLIAEMEAIEHQIGYQSPTGYGQDCLYVWRKTEVHKRFFNRMWTYVDGPREKYLKGMAPFFLIYLKYFMGGSVKNPQANGEQEALIKKADMKLKGNHGVLVGVNDRQDKWSIFAYDDIVRCTQKLLQYLIDNNKKFEDVFNPIKENKDIFGNSVDKCYYNKSFIYKSGGKKSRKGRFRRAGGRRSRKKRRKSRKKRRKSRKKRRSRRRRRR